MTATDVCTAEDPLFILTLPRCWSSLVSTMVGQHPQLYGLPETHLLVAEKVAGFADYCGRETFAMADGVLRAVAELGFQGQDEAAVDRARGWLRRRHAADTGLIMEALAEWAAPRIVVDKSPSLCYRVDNLRRAVAYFPRARFLHLVRHPRSYGDSVMRAITHAAAERPDAQAPTWLRVLASSPYAEWSAADPPPCGPYDPQDGWFVLNDRLRQFLGELPPERSLVVRGEDILTRTDDTMAHIAGWLGLRTDADAVAEMSHPERSPYACFGPDSARYGNDLTFLEAPTFAPKPLAPQSLEGPLPWRADGGGFTAAVRELADEFGYT